jgi:hypothetical protein
MKGPNLDGIICLSECLAMFIQRLNFRSASGENLLVLFLKIWFVDRMHVLKAFQPEIS